MLTLKDKLALALIGLILSLFCFTAPWKWQKDYNDAIQAFGTVAATVVALAIAFQQGRTARVVRAEDRERLHNSHKAKMHFALSRIHSHAAICVQILKMVIENPEEAETRPANLVLDFPRLEPRQPDPEAVRDVAECISSCPDIGTSRALSTLIEWTQIQTTRFEGLLAKEGQIVGYHEIFGLMLDSAQLQAMAAKCFPYARFQATSINIDLTGRDITNAFALNHILSDSPQFEKLFERVPAPSAKWRS